MCTVVWVYDVCDTAPRDVEEKGGAAARPSTWRAGGEAWGGGGAAARCPGAEPAPGLGEVPPLSLLRRRRGAAPPPPRGGEPRRSEAKEVGPQVHAAALPSLWPGGIPLGWGKGQDSDAPWCLRGRARPRPGLLPSSSLSPQGGRGLCSAARGTHRRAKERSERRLGAGSGGGNRLEPLPTANDLPSYWSTAVPLRLAGKGRCFKVRLSGWALLSEAPLACCTGSVGNLEDATTAESICLLRQRRPRSWALL